MSQKYRHRGGKSTIREQFIDQIKSSEEPSQTSDCPVIQIPEKVWLALRDPDQPSAFIHTVRSNLSSQKRLVLFTTAEKARAFVAAPRSEGRNERLVISEEGAAPVMALAFALCRLKVFEGLLVDPAQVGPGWTGDLVSAEEVESVCCRNHLSRAVDLLLSCVQREHRRTDYPEPDTDLLNVVKLMLALPG
jgi:hypothetical protein